jgi:hypothetical protein
MYLLSGCVGVVIAVAPALPLLPAADVFPLAPALSAAAVALPAALLLPLPRCPQCSSRLSSYRQPYPPRCHWSCMQSMHKSQQRLAARKRSTRRHCGDAWKVGMP